MSQFSNDVIAAGLALKIELPTPYDYFDDGLPGWTNLQIIEAFRTAAEADRQQRGEPVAFSYELATTRSADGEYTHWSPRLSYSMPNVPEGSIRNLHWLYATPQPSAPAQEPSDDDLHNLWSRSGGVMRTFARALLDRYGRKS